MTINLEKGKGEVCPSILAQPLCHRGAPHSGPHGHRPSRDWPFAQDSGQKANMDWNLPHASRRPALYPADLTMGHWSQQACEQVLSPPVPGEETEAERDCDTCPRDVRTQPRAGQIPAPREPCSTVGARTLTRTATFVTCCLVFIMDVFNGCTVESKSEEFMKARIALNTDHDVVRFGVRRKPNQLLTPTTTQQPPQMATSLRCPWTWLWS